MANINALKYILAAMVTAILLQSCSATKVSQSDKQGISGYIRILTGNQMPAPGRILGKGRGISCDIYFYAPTRLTDTKGSSPLFTAVNTRLILHARSDSTGYYAVKLPAGVYSVFIKQYGRFFAAERNGNGILNAVDIRPATVTHKDFVINNRASY